MASSPVLGQSSVKINFSDAATTAPTGWLKDQGQSYGNRGNGFTYGWVDPTTRQPVDISARGRNRNPTPDVDIFRETFIHMRFSDVTAGTQNGDWEIAIPNGTYRVTLQVGDADVENSIGTRHLIVADGVQIIDFSAPQGSIGVRNGTAVVNVTDGKLSVNADANAKNAKIHYITIEPTSALQTPVVLTTDPLDGLQNAFLNQFISIKTFSLPNGAINPATVTSQTVKLYEINGNVEIPSTVTFSNGQIGLQPNANLKALTNYRFIINGVKDQAGVDLLFFSSNFTTGNELYVPPTTNSYKVNFSDEATSAPSGWLKDFGQPYGDRGNGVTFGWVDPISRNPVSLIGRGRNRAPSPDKDIFRETFMHMRYGDVTAGAANGDWEIAVPNGTYRVTVQVGESDPEGLDGTRHIIVAEGLTLIDFVPALGSVGVRNATKVVTVTDGKLSINAAAVDKNTKLHFVIVEPTSGPQTPVVLNSIPLDGATKVSLNSTISANYLLIPNPGSNGATGTDNQTITTQTVKLFKVVSTGDEPVSGIVNGTGGGDAINFTPSAQLSPNTTYRFVIDGVKDLAGIRFLPFSAVFTTGDQEDTQAGNLDEVSFFNAGAVAAGAQYTTLTFGPDKKLYGLTLEGEIHRWVVGADGALSNQEVLIAWKSQYPARTAIGLTFDPKSTAQNLIAYVTHCSSGLNNAPEWDDKLSRISGPNLENEQLLLTNLPRSIRDHLTNSITFRPGEDNVLYFVQGSNSAGGAPDNAWGNRPEKLLSGAVLKLDLSKLPSTLPLNVQTSSDQAVINSASVNSPTMSDGTYNPYYINAPVTLVATGIRNAYDLVWHSNGQLYVPANGTAGGSLTPSSVNGMRRPDGTIYDYSNPVYPPIPSAGPNETQRDFLFRVDPAAGLGYYGHPNPLRGEYVMNRAKTDVAAYPSSVNPDPNYRGFAFDFEYNKSPNGAIEYKSSAHNNNLRGALLVVRYSFGDDIIAMLPNGPNKDIQTFKTGIPGFSGFNNPLDLIEDPNTGNIYVSEFGANQITLLRPIVGPVANNNLTATPSKIYTDDEVDGTAGKSYTITVSNTGAAAINGLKASLSGAGANQFVLNLSGFVTSLAPGQSTTLKVSLNASAVGPQKAVLLITDLNSQNVSQVALNGLGEAVGKEPSLQWIVDTQLGSDLVNIGDDDPSTDNINSANPTAPRLGSEVSVSFFRKADASLPVSMQVFGVYAPTTLNPITEFGWYESNLSNALKPLFSVDNTHDRTIDVKTNGSNNFEPEDKVFGFYTRWPVFSNRLVFTQDELNTFDPTTNHHVRVYPVPGQANTYILAFEEYVGAYDFQDLVVLVRNVTPVKGGVIALENLVKIPGTNISFPDDDYFAFSRVGAPSAGMRFHDENTVRIHNESNTVLTINKITISNTSLFTLPNKDVLPINIAANQYYDLKVKYIDSSGVRGVKNATLEITSNAENKPVLEAFLSGGFTTDPEGIFELSPQQVVNLFGFKTNTLAATIQGLPNSAYPTPAEVNAGLHGDIIVSEYFVQANPAEPVVHFRLADYGGISSYNSRLINSSGGIVAGISFNNAPEWYNSILPRTGILPSTPIAGDYAASITVPFRIQVADYNTSGRNGINAATGLPKDLGVRLYPVKDRQGKVKPYQYIIIQDFVGGGCIGTDGTASCDWNDIMDFIINIRPQANPTAPQVVNYSVEPGFAFTYDISKNFNPGYSGNKLTYEATLLNGNNLPTWINLNATTGEIRGNTPNTPNVIVEIKVVGTDLNGIRVESTFRINIGVVVTNPCAATGELLYEIWNNISGNSVNDLTSNANYPANPSSSKKLTTLVEGQTNAADNYGSRISGVLCAPQTGNYIFWIAGDDNSELWLSTDSTQANAQKIAGVPSWTNPREWGKFPEQQSAPIYLQAGKKYYLFVLQKEGAGGDNLAVGWQMPDGTQERPMATTYFSLPEVEVVPNPCTASGELLYEIWNNISGASVSNLTSNSNYPNNPTSSQKLTDLVEGQTNIGDNYGSRISGVLCAPETGNYVFWIAGDDNSELWLSTDNNPANAQKIAGVPSWTNPREWGKYPEQQSAAIALKAGEKYYVYVLHKEGGGLDNISVGWQMPNGALERPMSASYFSLPSVITAPDLGVFTDNGDIGSVGKPGNANHSNGTYTLQGAGADIWNSADGFHFIHKTHSGDGEIIARVNSVTLSNEWAKAGVMFRESTSAGSKMAMVLQRPDNQVTFQWRTDTGINAQWSGSLVGGTAAVKFLRLQRIGNEFKAFYSTDSENGPWTPIGNAVNISMNKDIKAGLALTSHDTGVLSTAVFDKVSLSNQVILPGLPPFGEVGQVQVNQNWTLVNFKNTYNKPIVVTGDPSYNDAAQTTVRVRNITSTGFEVRIQEWDCLDGTHGTETVSYIVVEQGSHVLANGKTLQAGKIAANSNWANYTFPQAFVEVPVILTQVTSVNEASSVITRLNHNNTTTSQFRLLLQEYQGSGAHANEDICWIAIEPGTQATGYTFEASLASRVADEVKRRFNFKQSYATPVFVGKISSYLGGDPITLRYNQSTINSTSVEVLGEEESCGDREVSHGLEDVHYLVFNGVGDLKAQGSSTPTPVVSALSQWKLDNNATDAIGNNNGTTQNGAGFSTSAKVGTHALNLDGNNDFVSVPNSTSLNVNANFSFSVWINPSATSGRRGILTKLTNASHKQYALSLNNGVIQFDYEKDGNNWDLQGGTVAANQWTFVILTVDAAGNVAIYLNGNLSASAKAPILTNLGDQPLEFGRWGGSYTDGYFAGRIDDVKFYNKALSLEEVGLLFNQTAGRAATKLSMESNTSETTEIALYPNPVSTNGNLNIQLKAPQGENLMLEVYNAQGLKVLDGFEVSMDQASKEISLTMSSLKPGVYFVATQCAGKTLYKRFIVTQE